MKKYLTYLMVFFNAITYISTAQTPSWTWAVGPNFTGSGYMSGKSIATDKNGNSYVTGSMQGMSNFGSSFINITSIGGFCILKFDSSGNPMWGQGSNQGNGYGIALDEFGNCFVTGQFQDTFCLANDTAISNGGIVDIFIAKYDTSGNLLWLRSGGGIGNDYVYGIASDILGSIYLTGSFQNTLRFGNDSLISSGGEDIFIAKFNNAGNLIWLRKAGGSNGEESYSISLDKNNLYITGFFSDTCIFGNDTLLESHRPHIFIAKYDSSGNFKWVRTNRGGSLVSVKGYGISAGKNGDCFVTGYFNDSLIFDNHVLGGHGHSPVIFTAKFDSAGNNIWIQKAPAGNLNSWGNAIAVDNFDNCFVTGQFKDTAYFGNISIISHGNVDLFMAKYDSAGNIQWVKQVGDVSADAGRGISFDDYGNYYLTGNVISPFGNVNFDSIPLFGYLSVAKISCNGIQPEISFTNSTLHSTTAATYQWFFNGTIIIGATSQSYTPLQNGIYTVYTKDANGCGSSSLQFNVIGLDINETKDGNSFYVFPNPSNDNFMFTYADSGDAIQKIEIKNLLGEMILSTVKNKIDMSAFSEGVYFYTIQTKAGKIFCGKIMKE